MKVASSEDVQRESECNPLIAAAVDDIYSLEDEPETKDKKPCPAVTSRKTSATTAVVSRKRKKEKV